MDSSVFARHTRLKRFPPAHLAYIIYRRLLEHGLGPTALWIHDKIARRFVGFSPPRYSRVQPLLFVGGQHYPRGLDAMRDLGIRAVVNMREESDDAQRGVALDHYLWLTIPDDDTPAPEDLARGAAFIAEQIEAGRGVYVHCAAGVGRAPTMAAAYLVSTGMAPDAAWETLRQTRSFIRPTPPQLEGVRRFARTLAAAVSEPDEPVLEPTVAFSLSGGDPMELRLQRADERISGDPGLTGDLTDDQAEILLAWARDEIRRLVSATQGLDDKAAWAILDPQLGVLRRHLRQIAKTGSQADDPAATLRSLLKPPAYPVAAPNSQEGDKDE